MGRSRSVGADPCVCPFSTFVPLFKKDARFLRQGVGEKTPS